MLEGPELSAHLLFYAHTLCMNYTTAMLLLVSCMSAHNHLNCSLPGFVQGQTPNSQKNIQQRTFLGFIAISFY